MKEKLLAILRHFTIRQLAWSAGCLFVLAVITLLFVIFFGKPDQKASLVAEQDLNKDGGNSVEQKDENKELIQRRIDGVKVEKGAEDLQSFAIVLDNHPDARPQSGLSKANLVYEAEAEGGITRFLAIYAGDDDVPEIGPVRSARPYLIDWANEYSAVFVHCGGSPEALAKLIKEKARDMNQFYLGNYFWRDNVRRAPHNVMTSSDKLKEYSEYKKYAKGDVPERIFKDEMAEEDRPKDAKEIVIRFRENFTVSWKYDIINNSYLRLVNDKLYQDRENNQIIAKNVIIQKVASEVIDEEKRLKVHNTGKGEAVICLDGACREGYWEKTTASSVTKYFYNSGNKEAEFNPGTTWIEIVNKYYKTEY